KWAELSRTSRPLRTLDLVSAAARGLFPTVEGQQLHQGRPEGSPAHAQSSSRGREFHPVQSRVVFVTLERVLTLFVDVHDARLGRPRQAEHRASKVLWCR